MALTTAQIEHIAHLARLELTDAEKIKFADQIGSILAYFNKLQEIDTTGVVPTSHSIDLVNVTRDDVIKEREQSVQERILQNAPAKQDYYFKVSKILWLILKL